MVHSERNTVPAICSKGLCSVLGLDATMTSFFVGFTIEGCDIDKAFGTERDCVGDDMLDND